MKWTFGRSVTLLAHSIADSVPGCIIAEIYLRRPLFYGRNSLATMEFILHTLGTQSKEDTEFVQKPRFRKALEMLKPREPVDLNGLIRGEIEGNCSLAGLCAHELCSCGLDFQDGAVQPCKENLG